MGVSPRPGAGAAGLVPVPAGSRDVPVRELLSDEVLDLLAERSRDEAGQLRLTGEGSMLGELVKAVLERALEAELTAHLGYGKHNVAGNNSGNSRNGRGKGKTVQTGVGPVRLSVPRDRAGTFEPVLVPKRAGRIAGGLDDMIISLYAHGMSVRDILHHLKQVYGTELSHEQVSRITDQVMDEVKAWQTRPLDPTYAVVFLDALVVKVTDNHVVQNKPAYIAVGIDTDGHKHVLGIWLARTPAESATAGESSRFWTSVTTDLRNRGVRDILIACCDGLKGFEDAIGAAFPATVVQTCVVHLIRNALRPVARKDAGAVARELKKIYTAVDADAALEALAEFADTDLGKRYPQAVKVFENAWDRFTPYFAFTRPVRKLLYTTNGIESLNYQLRKVTKARGHFPTDDAVVKLLWLAIVNIEDKRARERATKRHNGDKHAFSPARLVEGQRAAGWRETLNELADAYPGRIR
ncbi:IS256 family transposase [Actinomadura opuntiae]|uniref:IS256 family transposase n=1 Tax=Actinomadura sp. OS1-43 TaxID=604315 RepID=UPI00255A8BE2|nr:IS256 family transposase [Actinomadura sp. OS1-43]MDL4818573.1 IS256 family transposase [Actinomadura sp. OS1-43]